MAELRKLFIKGERPDTPETRDGPYGHPIIFCETPWGGLQGVRLGKDLSTMVLDECTHIKHIYEDLTGQSVKPWYGILKLPQQRETWPSASTDSRSFAR